MEYDTYTLTNKNLFATIIRRSIDEFVLRFNGIFDIQGMNVDAFYAMSPDRPRESRKI